MVVLYIRMGMKIRGTTRLGENSNVHGESRQAQSRKSILRMLGKKYWYYLIHFLDAKDGPQMSTSSPIMFPSIMSPPIMKDTWRRIRIANTKLFHLDLSHSIWTQTLIYIYSFCGSGIFHLLGSISHSETVVCYLERLAIPFRRCLSSNQWKVILHFWLFLLPVFNCQPHFV